ncbi:MAG: NAD-dependent epimerase/dehydratase family protein [Candidatus Omnitrophica bacterium]|nr:NAD-dependent epimerase/dehydratase family protein [Candidatus Omnitrophota bacterium]
MMNFFHGKKILVTGGTGLIGRPLVEMLIDKGARVRIASLDDPSRAHAKAEFKQANLMKLENCLDACEGIDFVFHLAGIKGSPAMTAKKPASFFVPTITFNTNMMEAARVRGVKRYLFTSTIGVYAPAEIFKEDDVWKTLPSENDRFAGWAKRMGELQAEAYAIEYGWKDIAIVRPANVYGPYDNFDPENAMVIPSLIRRAFDGEDPLTVWGDGSAIRDFIHAKDVAQGMLLVMEKLPGKPVNLGSGNGATIRNIVEIIVRNLDKKPDVIWDTAKPSGDKLRLMDMARAHALGFQPQISIEEGIRETMEWYKKNKDAVHKRYNVFKEAKFF